MLTPSVWGAAIEHVLAFEGGKVDDPVDLGGRTAYGITQTTYQQWRVDQRLRARDVFEIEPLEVLRIYRARYWERARGPEFEGLGAPRLAFVLFDCFVNHGGKTTARFVQRAYGLTVDGAFGPVTWGAVTDSLHHRGEVATIETILAARLDQYERIIAARPSQAKFRQGWKNRVAKLRAAIAL